MVYGVQAHLAFSSAARRDDVRNNIETRVVTKPRWSDTLVESVSDVLGPHVLRVSMRFVSQLDADDLMSGISAFMTGPRTPNAGSSITTHTCTHDEDVNVCVPVAKMVW